MYISGIFPIYLIVMVPVGVPLLLSLASQPQGFIIDLCHLGFEAAHRFQILAELVESVDSLDFIGDATSRIEAGVIDDQGVCLPINKAIFVEKVLGERQVIPVLIFGRV